MVHVYIANVTNVHMYMYVCINTILVLNKLCSMYIHTYIHMTKVPMICTHFHTYVCITCIHTHTCTYIDSVK